MRDGKSRNPFSVYLDFLYTEQKSVCGYFCEGQERANQNRANGESSSTKQFYKFKGVM